MFDIVFLQIFSHFLNVDKIVLCKLRTKFVIKCAIQKFRKSLENKISSAPKQFLNRDFL